MTDTQKLDEIREIIEELKGVGADYSAVEEGLDAIERILNA
jgi:hypothetical protein